MLCCGYKTSVGWSASYVRWLCCSGVSYLITLRGCYSCGKVTSPTTISLQLKRSRTNPPTEKTWLTAPPTHAASSRSRNSRVSFPPSFSLVGVESRSLLRAVSLAHTTLAKVSPAPQHSMLLPTHHVHRPLDEYFPAVPIRHNPANRPPR